VSNSDSEWGEAIQAGVRLVAKRTGDMWVMCATNVEEDAM
jgi:hypothetical protein